MEAYTRTHLVIVCCHGIWTGNDPSDVYSSEPGADQTEWLLAPFQDGEASTFIDHIKAGLVLLLDPESLLIFSGGPTRKETKLSEAASYALLARTCKYWDIIPKDAESRIVVEERALDSFQNVLFSLTKFYEVTGSWPQRLSIVSHEFKRSRFLGLHCHALRWPQGRVKFIGIDPPYMREGVGYNEERTESVRKGERMKGFGAWKKDALGNGDELVAKREGRNVWGVWQDIFERPNMIVISGFKPKSMGEMGSLYVEEQPWEKWTELL